MSTCPPQEDPITWTTTFRGRTYVLGLHGQLEPATTNGAAMSTAHLEQSRQDRSRHVQRAVHDELLALAIRRMEYHPEEEQR